MDVLQELQRKSDKEIKQILDKNKFIKKGAYVIYDNEVHLVEYRCKNEITLLPSYKFIDIDRLKLLTYKLYKEIVNNKRQKILSKNNVFESILNKQLSVIFDKNNFEVTDKNIIIYFPKLIIKNSLDIEHELLDVYVQFSFKYNNNLILDNIYLYRATYKDYEVAHNYTFSHASNTCGNRVSKASFCFGKTPLADIIDNYSYKGIDFRQIVPLIFAFKEYLEWESIEGVPHRYLTKLKPYSIDRIYVSEFTKESKIILQELYTKYLESFTYKFELNHHNGYRASISKESKELIKKHILKIINESEIINENVKEDLIGYSDGDSFGKLKPLKDIKVNFQSFNFKGNVVDTKIIETELDLEKLNLIPTLNPGFLNQIIIQLENDFNNFYNNFKTQ